MRRLFSNLKLAVKLDAEKITYIKSLCQVLSLSHQFILNITDLARNPKKKKLFLKFLNAYFSGVVTEIN